MALWDFIRRPAEAATTAPPPGDGPTTAARAEASQQPGQVFQGLDDPALLEFIRSGGDGTSGKLMSLRNMTVLRCVSLICGSIGRLPLNLMERGDAKKHANAHPVYRLLRRKPNGWQTPIEFKSSLQLSVLAHGAGYARVIWSRGRPLQLIPLPFDSVREELVNFEMQFIYTPPSGEPITLTQREMFVVRDLTVDGVKALARMRLAREAIELALLAQKAAGRVFKTGVMASGAIEVEKELSDPAYKRMKESIRDGYSGADNAGNWMLLEGGAKANKWASTADEAQHVENRSFQIEEACRAFDVPRPLAMMDDTSWGSGIEQLSILFVQYGLSTWFTAWEEAVARTLLTDDEADQLQAKFNERALLRGTLKDQGEYMARALGSGGHAPWSTQNEVRDVLDMPRSDDPNADKLRNPMTQSKQRTNDEPAATT